MSRPRLRLLKFEGAKVDEMQARQVGRRLQRLSEDDRALVTDLVEALIVLPGGAKQHPAAARALVRDLTCSTASALMAAAAADSMEAC